RPPPLTLRTHPLLFVAVAAAALAAAVARSPRFRPPRGATQAPASASLPPSLCPPGSLPDEGVCIPVPEPRNASTRARASIPRRPDRDPSFARYAMPVAGASVADDVDTPDAGASRDGITLNAPAGAAVASVPLEGQSGPTTVVYAGALV